jgi:hypothetical protein
MIQCNEINQTINQLLASFENCNKIKNEDLQTLVELVSAVNTCANGGVDYGVETTEIYEPLITQVITYPINTFHSYSIMILQGSITQTVSFSTIVYPTGTVLNTEFTNLNQTAITFTINPGSKIVVKYLTETL